MRYKCFLLVSLIYVSCIGVTYARDLPPENNNLPVASHLVFEYEDKAWQIDLAMLGFDGIDPTTVNREVLQQKLDEIVQEVERRPKNAYFHKRAVVPHVTGRRVDRRQLNHWADYLVWHQNEVLTLPVIETVPEISSETLSRITEKVLGSYTTTFNPNNTPRVNNVKLSSQAIDYVVVPKGEVFSFNEVVGPRTSARGYQPAPVIVRGEYSEGVGGGICQTSSTLFNSVDQAGLKIVERSVHSKRVTYVPKGRDATVSWGGPDFKFENDTNRPILIASVVHNGHITVTVYSQDDAQSDRKKVPPPPNGLPPLEQEETTTTS